MYTVTDIAAVDAIIIKKTPRPWKEIVLEVYPDATIDCNGRAHAPYAGYECSITGDRFGAGEYLPMSEPENESQRSAVATARAIDVNGVEHEWHNLTKSQRMAVYAELLAQSKAYDASKSDFVGIVGQKVTVDVVIQMVKSYTGSFGMTYFHVMKDSNGSVIFYKGAKRIAEKGSSVKVAAKIKSHDTRDGVKQTVIERPKLI
jgi:hypothetical protein